MLTMFPDNYCNKMGNCLKRKENTVEIYEPINDNIIIDDSDNVFVIIGKTSNVDIQLKYLSKRIYKNNVEERNRYNFTDQDLINTLDKTPITYASYLDDRTIIIYPKICKYNSTFAPRDTCN